MKRMLAAALALLLLSAGLSGCMAQQKHTDCGNRMLMTIAETSGSCGCTAFEYRVPGQPYCFYAYDLEGKFYRVLWPAFEGLHEKDLIAVEYSSEIREIDEWKLDGGYTPQYEITATHVSLERDVLASCLTHEDDAYMLTLPQSGEQLELAELQTRFVPYITDTLVEAAESKLTQEASGFDNHSKFFLQIQEDHLCLVFEVIRHVDDPEAFEEDHEHLFYAERISTQALPMDPEIDTEIGIKDHTKSLVTYCSGDYQTAALSTLLHAREDNGDGSFTETTVDMYDIVDLLNGKTHISTEELKIPTLPLDGNVSPLVPENGEIERVSLLTEGENGVVKSDSTFDALSQLAPGAYYVVVYVLYGNDFNFYRYEDVFRLEVGEARNRR